MILQDIKETKCYGHTFGRTVGRSDDRTDGQRENSIVCGGIKIEKHTCLIKENWLSGAADRVWQVRRGHDFHTGPKPN